MKKKDEITNKEEFLRKTYEEYKRELNGAIANIDIFNRNMIELRENNITFDNFVDKLNNEVIEEKQKRDKIQVKDCLKYYKSKESLTTGNEYKLYRCLEELFNNDYKDKDLQIFVQVSMSQLINIKGADKFYAPLNFISRKSIDFVIAEKEKDNKKNLKIKFCIEVDGTEHETDPERIKSDETKDIILESVGIKLIRIKNKNYYEKDKINALIKDYI